MSGASEFKQIPDHFPRKGGRYLVSRLETGPFVATVCYGLHDPWWVPEVVNHYSPGAFVVPMRKGDQWIEWPVAITAELKVQEQEAK